MVGPSRPHGRCHARHALTSIDIFLTSFHARKQGETGKPSGKPLTQKPPENLAFRVFSGG